MKQISTTPLPSTLDGQNNHSPTNGLNRRAVLAGFAALGVSGMQPASALSVNDAEGLIRKVVGEVLSIIGAGKPLDAMLDDFEGIFARYADRTRIASSILGQPWRGASKAERAAYVEALTGYLARKYGKQFAQFEGGELEINRSNDYGRKGVIVQTKVKTNQYAPFPVDWHVIEAGSGPKFFDIIIEGVKLLASERAEVRAVLERNKNSVTALTAALKKMG